MSAATSAPSDYKPNRHLYTKERLFDAPAVGSLILLNHMGHIDKRFFITKKIAEVVSVGPKQVSVRELGYTYTHRLSRHNHNGEFSLSGGHCYSKYRLQPVNQ